MTNDTNKAIRSHYAEVAAMATNAQLDEDTGFHIVTETRTACSLEKRSEALNIYDEQLLDGIPQRALIASRGCGDPVSCACLEPGERVIDLGCGGGVDAIIASRLVGPRGAVYGLDMTPEMIELARANTAAVGANNITYIEGAIEDIPLPDASLDVVLSNCVINFSQDKRAVLSEALRVLKPGGRFVISDIVEFANVAPKARPHLCCITGCTNGMLSTQAYSQLLADVGFCRSVIEPKTIYTRAVLLEKSQRKNRLDSYKQLEGIDVDSKTGSVVIYAWK